MTAIDAHFTEDSRPNLGLRPWFVCFIAALFFFYEFIQMNMFNSINQELMAAFQINGTELDFLTSVYFLSNVIFLLPAGLLLDRFSTRKIFLTALSICVVGTLAFSLASSLPLATICRFLTGIGSAFCFVGCVRLASRWFPAKRMALVTGLIITMAMIGGMVAQTPMTLLTIAVGWRHALMIDAALGAVILGLVYLFVQDCPPHMRDKLAQDNEYLSVEGFWHSMKTAYLNSQNWLGAIYTCLMNLPVMILGAVWGTLYAEQVHHLSKTQASYITDMIFLGTIIGAPLAGWLSDRMEKRKPLMLAGAIVSIILVSVIIYIPDVSLSVLMALFGLLGLITSTQVISYPTIAESNPSALTAASVSVISFTTIGGGGVVLLPFFGWLMSIGWNQLTVDGVAIYSMTNYHSAMLLMPVAFAIAFVAALGLRETYCRKHKDN
ncbi:MAG: MFS transporter [Legionellales bacterium]|nr:MFS transporter [Legionellales bacterium]|tara:strand:- start:2104 stop:3414 length:1311 start_codon:yes stop_codon:yes gene_type:complete